MATAALTPRPVFNTPIRWIVRVLAWLAFGVTAYLAWSAINSTPVFGCGMGSANGCDEVLNSSYAKWLGVPVAVVGLACYAALAGLSVLLGLQNSSASRWITTFFVMLSIVAAGGSLWFIAVQAVALDAFCPYCLVADTCGILLGALTIWSTVRWWQRNRYMPRVGNSSSGLMALRSALPAGARTVPAVIQRPLQPAQPPSLPVAFGGALALLALLIGGQLVFPAKAFDVQKVSLNQTIALNGSDEAEASNDEASTDAQTRVAMRVPTEGDTQPAATDVAPTENGDHNESTPAKDAADASIKPNDDPKPTAEGNGPASTAPSPERERNIKLLDGKLTLNVYEHPLLGSPEAKYIVVDMISYNCTHCRKMHATMKRALARYGDQVAVIVMPIPMEKACNRLVTDSAASHAGACTTAGMSLGVARLKPYAFARFHDWLMTDEKEPPPLDAIIARSYGIVDRNRLRELRSGDKITKQIAQYIDLFDMLQKQHKGDKKFGLPVQILGDHIMTGSVENAEDVFKAWEEHLGVKAR